MSKYQPESQAANVFANVVLSKGKSPGRTRSGGYHRCPGLAGFVVQLACNVQVF